MLIFWYFPVWSEISLIFLVLIFIYTFFFLSLSLSLGPGFSLYHFFPIFFFSEPSEKIELKGEKRWFFEKCQIWKRNGALAIGRSSSRTRACLRSWWRSLAATASRWRRCTIWTRSISTMAMSMGWSSCSNGPMTRPRRRGHLGKFF